MNIVDAVCVSCGASIRWLPGTPRMCAPCSQNKASTAFFSTFILLPILLLNMLLAGCSGIINTTKDTGTQVRIQETPMLTPAREYRIYNIGLDVSNNGSLSYFTEERIVLADWIDKAVEPGPGWLVNISFIGANGFDASAVKLQINIPAIPTDTVTPTLVPTPTPSGDPYKDQQNGKAVDEENAKRVQVWQQTLHTNHVTLTQIRAYVHEQTNKLRTLEPGSHSSESDVAGFLARCAQHSAGTLGKTYVYIASTLRNTTSFPAHPVSLASAIVRFFWFATSDPKTDAQTTHLYHSTLAQMGVSNIAFLDVSKTRVLPNPFRYAA